VNRPAVALAIGLIALSCHGPTTGTDSLAAWGDPLGTAVSPCGRYTLGLQHAEWRTAAGQRPQLSLQLALRTGDPDVLLCGTARVTDLVPPDGVEFREGDLGGLCDVDGRSGTLFFHGLEVYEAGPSLRRLRIECHVLRVHSWRRYDLLWREPGGEDEIVCPPYHLGLSGDERCVRIAAWCGDDLASFPPAQRDLFGILGHDWVARGASVVDAADRPLFNHSAAMTGSATAATYARFDSLAPAGENDRPAALAFPVRGTLLLPERYTVEIVPFEFADLPLVRQGVPRPAEPAALRPLDEDRKLEAELVPLSDPELFARGITSVDQPGGKLWAVAWTEDQGPAFDAVDRVLREAGIPGGAVCALGMCGWYVPRDRFFASRRALLGDPEVVRLGVAVVTPHPASP